MVKNIYDKIADQYDQDIFNIFAKTRQIVRTQIQQHVRPPIPNALDFAIGTGTVYQDLIQHGVPLERMIGIDISKGMLAVAKQKLGPRLETICDDLANIRTYVQNATQDLILCHYVFSYCDLDRTLQDAAKILKPGGTLSVASTTKQNFSELLKGRFEKTAKMVRADRYLAMARIPASHADLKEKLKSYGFEITADDRIKEQVTFNNYREVENWAYDAGWAATYFEKSPLLKLWKARATFGLAAIKFRPLYPVHTTTDISVVLARKI